MPSDDETDGPDPLGPARPILTAALRLGGRAAGTGDHAGAYALFACAAKLARKVRGLGEVADFRLERALEAAEGEGEPAAQAEELQTGLEALVGDDDPEEDPLPDAPLAAAQALIARAISIGAPAYNTGDHQGCYDVYACTARLLANAPSAPDAMKDALRRALAEASVVPNVTRQARIMREAFDALIGEEA